MDQPIAHLDPGTGAVHPLEGHLESTAELAALHADNFGSSKAAYLLGRVHDLGKACAGFQEMINANRDGEAHVEDGTKRRVEHSGQAGAFLQDRALSHHGQVGKLFALISACHHSGLRNLDYWKEDRLPRARKLLEKIPKDLLDTAYSDMQGFILPDFLKTATNREEACRKLEFWCRMLFSCLVDADFLDTETFFEAGRTDARKGFPPLTSLADRLTGFLRNLTDLVPDTEVNRIRRQVLGACQESAAHAPGVFSLTVPTGGGKTYASLSFALEHARLHGHERIIVVAPFLTIIDQTVAAYAKALANEEAAAQDELPFIEHHSGVEPQRETARNRLASENWDAPLVVTTAVQFFESLFATRTSACRKLHSLARSVIVIDEAQTMPGEYLVPIINVLQELADNYGTSIVLSTATQPDLAYRVLAGGRQVQGFRDIREINSFLKESFEKLRRVDTSRLALDNHEEKESYWEELASHLVKEPQVLVITHLRKDAYQLALRVRDRYPRDELIHVSALMCPAHRAARIEEIRTALREKRNIRVVSTQLVEAGVDLDFPVVYRAMAGFDSLIQSAGRCNREGNLEAGKLVIFDAPTKPPVGTLRTAADTASAEFVANPDLDLFDPEIYRAFDRKLNRIADREGIQNLRAQFRYEDVHRAFRLIDDSWQTSVVVPWESKDGRISSIPLLTSANSIDNPTVLRSLARKLQRFSVGISTRHAQSLLAQGVLTEINDLFLTLSDPYTYLYDQEFGLQIPNDLVSADPTCLIG